MPTRVTEESSATLRFGGGIHSRASEADIDPQECALGANFELDLQNQEFRNRQPFDLVTTAPNAAEIRGFVTLLKTDGTVAFAFQAGDTVYQWDGINTPSSIGTVNSGARLRGRLEHNWQLQNKVIVTDLALLENVKEWDGTSNITNVAFTDEDDNSFGTFKAKYCYIASERVVFANIDDGNPFPHLIVGTKRGDYTQITVANRPSSAISTEDPFFLVQPDYFPINGVVQAYQEVITSSRNGNLWRLTGNDAQDFAFESLFPRSGAQGDESLAFVGNDIMYGRAGRLESVNATDRFGDVANKDISVDIEDQIIDFDDWTTVYNSRTQRVYFFPTSGSEVWVLNKNIYLAQQVSAWSKFTTRESVAFQPSAVLNMLDPRDGLEYVFFGDDSGNVYRMEGTGTGDAGSSDIEAFRLSKLIEPGLDAHVYNVAGWVRYRRDVQTTLTLQFEYAGENLFNETVSMVLDPAEDVPLYSDGRYYNDGNYYAAAFRGRLTRKVYVVPSDSTEFQVRATVDGSNDFSISEIGIRFSAAS